MVTSRKSLGYAGAICTKLGMHAKLICKKEWLLGHCFLLFYDREEQWRNFKKKLPEKRVATNAYVFLLFKMDNVTSGAV